MAASVVHQCPRAGQNGEPSEATLPCCGRWIHEMISSADKITNDPAQVTCGGEDPECDCPGLVFHSGDCSIVADRIRVSNA